MCVGVVGGGGAALVSVMLMPGTIVQVWHGMAQKRYL